MGRLAATVVLFDELSFITRKYRKSIYAGEPSNITRILSDLWADELFVINVSPDSGEAIAETLGRISSQTFIPLTYGGNVNSLEKAELIARLGFEKILLETALTENPDLAGQIAASLGSSSLIASFSFMGEDWFSWRDKKPLDQNLLLDLLEQVQSLGAGEIKVNAIQKDGGLAGPDLSLVKRLKERIHLPLVYQGGVSSLDDARRLWDLGVDCVAASSWFMVRPPRDAILVSFPKWGGRI